MRPASRRWLIVAALFTVTYGVSTPLAAYGVFLPVFAETFAWSRGAISTALSLNLLLGGIAGIGIGALADRHGPRVMLVVTVILAGSAFALVSLVGSLWQLYLLVGVLGGVGMSSFYLLSTTTVTRWFDEHRGLALALVLVGFNLGYITAGPLSAWLITKLGLASPKTMLLPNKDYIPGIKHDESLRNLQFPLDWEGIARHVGMPCILKDAHGGGWKEVHVCRSLEELISRYDQSGLLTMIVQEFINWDEFVRCLCIGQEDILPIKYDPRERRYIPDDDFLAPDLRKRVVNDALTIVRALGYDMNSIEFAIRDGVPYAIDFMNPAPDMDINSLTPRYFEWVVNHMADLSIALAKKPRRQVKDLKWDKMFVKGRKG